MCTLAGSASRYVAKLAFKAENWSFGVWVFYIQHKEWKNNRQETKAVLTYRSWFLNHLMRGSETKVKFKFYGKPLQRSGNRLGETSYSTRFLPMYPEFDLYISGPDLFMRSWFPGWLGNQDELYHLSACMGSFFAIVASTNIKIAFSFILSINIYYFCLKGEWKRGKNGVFCALSRIQIPSSYFCLFPWPHFHMKTTRFL